MIMAITEKTKEKIVFIVALIVLILLALLAGCSLFGGQSVKPSASLAQKVATALEKTDELSQKFEKINGDITTIKQDFIEYKTEITTTLNQVTSNIQYNEPLSKYLLYFLIFVVIMRLINAWLDDKPETKEKDTWWNYVKHIFRGF